MLLTRRENKSQQAPCLSEVLGLEAEDRWQMRYQRVKLDYQIRAAEAVQKAGVKAAKAARAPTGCEPNFHAVPTQTPQQRLFPHPKVYAEPCYAWGPHGAGSAASAHVPLNCSRDLNKP